MIAPTSALYYPSIDVTNERWLRSACLFWDEISTIVPASVREPYSSAFNRALEENGVLRPVIVHSDMDEIDDLFEDVMKFIGDESSIDFAISNANVHYIHPEKMPYGLREFMNLNMDKLPYKIRDHLDAISHDGWARVPAEFANFYMTLLATRLSNRLGLALATPSAAADRFATVVRRGRPSRRSDIDGPMGYGRRFGATGARRSPPAEVTTGLLAELMFESINLPESVPVEALLKFKRDHFEELGRLRIESSRLVKDIPDCSSIESVRQRVNDQYVNEVKPALASLKKSISAQRWETGLGGLLKASFLSAAPTSALLALGLSTPMALLSGVGISVTATASLMMLQDHQARVASPYSYLLAMESKW